MYSVALSPVPAHSTFFEVARHTANVWFLVLADLRFVAPEDFFLGLPFFIPCQIAGNKNPNNRHDPIDGRRHWVSSALPNAEESDDRSAGHKRTPVANYGAQELEHEGHVVHGRSHTTTKPLVWLYNSPCNRLIKRCGFISLSLLERLIRRSQSPCAQDLPFPSQIRWQESKSRACLAALPPLATQTNRRQPASIRNK